MITILFLSLCVISLILYIWRKKQPNKDFSPIWLRVKMWWGMFVVFSLATLSNPVVTLLSLMVLCFFALREYFSLWQTRKSDRRLFLWAYVTIPIQFYWIYIEWYGMFIVFIPVYVFLFLPLPRMIGKGTVGFLRSVSSTQWGLMLMVFGLSHLAYFPFATPQYGANLVLFLVILTQLNDVIQNIYSIYFGKYKIVPSANPYITWGGMVFSLVMTMLVSFWLFRYLTPFPALYGVLSGAVISISGFIGILTVSVLRRDLLLGKDGSEKLIKGRYLNRVDSLAYTAPIFFHVTRYFFEFM
ncbi:phosphatidate cytidylyltransferase [Radiobacillus sp. PE A8.2]|uniref:phosphatidate cytidylyltransferase n=1 Tax=Radiobacillus sp. PE A8.2 TaxID=3380349 RepID=UPI00388E6400